MFSSPSSFSMRLLLMYSSSRLCNSDRPSSFVIRLLCMLSRLRFCKALKFCSNRKVSQFMPQEWNDNFQSRLTSNFVILFFPSQSCLRLTKVSRCSMVYMQYGISLFFCTTMTMQHPKCDLLWYGSLPIRDWSAVWVLEDHPRKRSCCSQGKALSIYVDGSSVRHAWSCWTISPKFWGSGSI